MEKETSVIIGSIKIILKFEKEPDQVSIVEAANIADRLRLRVDTLADTIKKSGAELILHFLNDGQCRLEVNGPEELKGRITDLVEPAETWS